jgi:hypothetical protein
MPEGLSGSVYGKFNATVNIDMSLSTMTGHDSWVETCGAPFNPIAEECPVRMTIPTTWLSMYYLDTNAVSISDFTF